MINKYLIGKKIQQRRIEQKITQEELAEAVEISSNYLSKVERGLNMLSADVLLRIIEFLEMDLKDFEIFSKKDKYKLSQYGEILLYNCKNETLRLLIPVMETIIKICETKD